MSNKVVIRITNMKTKERLVLDSTEKKIERARRDSVDSIKSDEFEKINPPDDVDTKLDGIVNAFREVEYEFKIFKPNMFVLDVSRFVVECTNLLFDAVKTFLVWTNNCVETPTLEVAEIKDSDHIPHTIRIMMKMRILFNMFVELYNIWKDHNDRIVYWEKVRKYNSKFNEKYEIVSKYWADVKYKLEKLKKTNMKNDEKDAVDAFVESVQNAKDKLSLCTEGDDKVLISLGRDIINGWEYFLSREGKNELTFNNYSIERDLTNAENAMFKLVENLKYILEKYPHTELFDSELVSKQIYEIYGKCKTLARLYNLEKEAVYVLVDSVNTAIKKLEEITDIKGLDMDNLLFLNGKIQYCWNKLKDKREGKNGVILKPNVYDCEASDAEIALINVWVNISSVYTYYSKSKLLNVKEVDFNMLEINRLCYTISKKAKQDDPEDDPEDVISRLKQLISEVKDLELRKRLINVLLDKTEEDLEPEFYKTPRVEQEKIYSLMETDGRFMCQNYPCQSTLKHTNIAYDLGEYSFKCPTSYELCSIHNDVMQNRSVYIELEVTEKMDFVTVYKLHMVTHLDLYRIVCRNHNSDAYKCFLLPCTTCLASYIQGICIDLNEADKVTHPITDIKIKRVLPIFTTIPKKLTNKKYTHISAVRVCVGVKDRMWVRFGTDKELENNIRSCPEKYLYIYENSPVHVFYSFD